MSVKVKLDPTVDDLIFKELSHLDCPNLSKAVKSELVRSVIRGVHWFTVCFESQLGDIKRTWFESTEADDFDMSQERKGLVFAMTGLPFIPGCHHMSLDKSHLRENLGLTCVFHTPNRRWNKAKTQYEFLTRAWRAAARVFIEYQK